MTRNRRSHHSVDLSDDLWDEVVAVSERLDLSHASLVCMVLDGAIRLGQVVRLVEASKVTPTRRNTPTWDWKLAKPGEWVATPMSGRTYHLSKDGDLHNRWNTNCWILRTPSGHAISLSTLASESKREASKIIAAEVLHGR